MRRCTPTSPRCSSRSKPNWKTSWTADAFKRTLESGSVEEYVVLAGRRKEKTAFPRLAGIYARDKRLEYKIHESDERVRALVEEYLHLRAGEWGRAEGKIARSPEYGCMTEKSATYRQIIRDLYDHIQADWYLNRPDMEIAGTRYNSTLLLSL